MVHEGASPKIYEVRAKDRGQELEEFVVGWTATADGEPLVEIVKRHPVWTDPVVVEKLPGKKREEKSGKKVTPVSDSPSIYTIGHSNHTMAKFVDLLKRNQIEVVVDVRSKPYSRFARHFAKETLQTGLKENGFKYLFLGKELGGKPEDQIFYDENGQVLYDKIAETEAFRGGIERLVRGIQAYNVAILCAEEDPSKCHRSFLVGKALMEAGVTLRHIRKSGEIEIQAKEEMPMQLVMDGFSRSR